MRILTTGSTYNVYSSEFQVCTKPKSSTDISKLIHTVENPAFNVQNPLELFLLGIHDLVWQYSDTSYISDQYCSAMMNIIIGMRDYNNSLYLYMYIRAASLVAEKIGKLLVTGNQYAHCIGGAFLSCRR